MANKQPVVLRYLSGVISLLVGTSIYLIWRPSSLFNGVDYMPWVRQALPSPPLWLINTMPDALWFAALLCFQTPLKRNLRPVLTIIACCIGPLHEILQGVKIVPGTFCWQDLITYFTIIIIYFIICLNPLSKKTRQAIPAIAIVAFVAMILACSSSKYSTIKEQQDNQDRAMLTDSIPNNLS